MATALRPLTLGELLDRTFQLYRRHFVVFTGIVALPYLLSLAFQLSGTMFNIVSPLRFSLGSLVWLLAGLVVSLLVATMSQAATVVAVSELHLDHEIAIGQAFARIKGRIPELCFISVAVGILVGLGFLALVIPGILLLLRWALVVPVAVLEQAGLRTAMSRSAELTDGDRGRVFVIFFLYFMLTMILSAVWQMPLAVATFATTRIGQAPPTWVQVTTQVAAFVTQCLVLPLSTIAFSLVYYDERVRKEAFDLEHMMAQLDRPLGDSTVGA